MEQDRDCAGGDGSEELNYSSFLDSSLAAQTYEVCTGPISEGERAYLLRRGLALEDSLGELYGEPSTIFDSEDSDASMIMNYTPESGKKVSNFSQNVRSRSNRKIIKNIYSSETDSLPASESEIKSQLSLLDFEEKERNIELYHLENETQQAGIGENLDEKLANPVVSDCPVLSSVAKQDPALEEAIAAKLPTQAQQSQPAALPSVEDHESEGEKNYKAADPIESPSHTVSLSRTNANNGKNLSTVQSESSNMFDCTSSSGEEFDDTITLMEKILAMAEEQEQVAKISGVPLETPTTSEKKSPSRSPSTSILKRCKKSLPSLGRSTLKSISPVSKTRSPTVPDAKASVTSLKVGNFSEEEKAPASPFPVFLGNCKKGTYFESPALAGRFMAQNQDVVNGMYTPASPFAIQPNSIPLLRRVYPSPTRLPAESRDGLLVKRPIFKPGLVRFTPPPSYLLKKNGGSAVSSPVAQYIYSTPTCKKIQRAATAAAGDSNGREGQIKAGGIASSPLNIPKPNVPLELGGFGPPKPKILQESSRQQHETQTSALNNAGGKQQERLLLKLKPIEYHGSDKIREQIHKTETPKRMELKVQIHKGVVDENTNATIVEDASINKAFVPARLKECKKT